MPAILCVFAHSDDEAFGCAATLARYATQGIPVDLLCFTPGQHGERLDPLASPDDVGALRARELMASASVIGARQVQTLDYVDGALSEVPTAELAAIVAACIERTKATAIITFGPLGVTRHPDHIAAHRAVLDAVRGSTRPPAVFYFVPEGAFDELRLEGPETAPTHRIPVDGFFDAKLTALACHSSQRDAREFFLRWRARPPTHEAFHRAIPAFTGAAPARDLFHEDPA
ncbi:MAG TPA: PIG-L family deacetylase [Dehalococcoidia bacterium]|nr:PIG-L family deacetylase [Dehalococcoidia bacterium]